MELTVLKAVMPFFLSPRRSRPRLHPARTGDQPMKHLVVALALLGAMVSPAASEPATSEKIIPDLKGTWTGKGKAIVFGNHIHHPGSQTTSDPPRVRDIVATHVVEGQDGRVAWGRSSSAVADTKEPFVWAIASDNRSIIGADSDGYFRIMLLTANRMEKCYVHNGTSPSHSIVASCYMMDRAKR